MFDAIFDKFGLVGGVGICMGVCFVAFLLVAVVLESRTRALFPEHGKKRGDDGWLDFGDDE